MRKKSFMLMVAASFAVAGAALSQGAADILVRDNPMQNGATWDDLRHNVLPADVTPVEGTGLLDLDAPFRAHDPAIVPVRLQAAVGTTISELVLVIDENPAPVAAVFSFSDAMQPLDMEVRVRVDAYSNIRAIGRTPQGDSVMSGRFVRATGGCAAPSAKDAAAAQAHMGQMRLQELATETVAAGLRREVKLMLRHPNYSGLQRDQVTLLNIPAHFIDSVEVRQGDELLFSVSGGISISEDPVYVFKYLDDGTGALTVEAVDTKGNVYRESFGQGAG